jgi:FkbM family methyltransferase
MANTARALLRSLPFYSLIRSAYRTAFNREQLNLLRESVRFFSQFIRPGDLVFDVGANYGSRTHAFLELGATVCAVEPQPECVAELRATYGRNPRFTLVEKGVGPAPGSAVMYLSEKTTKIATLSPTFRDKLPQQEHLKDNSYEKSTEVEITTLDLMIAQLGVPAFCKLDIEGFEDEALKGLSRPIPALSFEYTPWLAHVAVNSIDRLVAIDTGYTFNLCSGESMALDGGQWVSAGEMRERIASIGTSWRDGYGDVYARLPVA